MTLDIERDMLISLWRQLEKQPMTLDDQQRVEELSGVLFDALSSDKPKRKYTAYRNPKPKTAQTTEQNEEPTDVDISNAPSGA
jgi:hypothetical protein